MRINIKDEMRATFLRAIVGLQDSSFTTVKSNPLGFNYNINKDNKAYDTVDKR